MHNESSSQHVPKFFPEWLYFRFSGQYNPMPGKDGKIDETGDLGPFPGGWGLAPREARLRAVVFRALRPPLRQCLWLFGFGRRPFPPQGGAPTGAGD